MAGATLSGDGSVVLVLDMEDLLAEAAAAQQAALPGQQNHVRLPDLLGN